MTKDEAAQMALEALEWSYGGEPMPTKELEAINALRQVLSQPDRSPTVGYAKKIEQLIKERDELRQALAEWTPDDTAYRPDGLSMPIDRGAWSDLEDATKWVDELRGDDKQCSSCGGFCGDVCKREDVKPIGEIVEAHGLIAVSIPEMPPVGTKLYAQPIFTQTCCGCGLSGGYAMYCGWYWSKFDKQRQWVGLTPEQRNNIMQQHGNDWKKYTEAVEQQLQENNS